MMDTRDYSYTAHGVHVDPPDGEHSISIVRLISCYVALVVLIVVAIVYAVSIRDTYAEALAAKAAAEKRAANAEAQLAIMLKHGDGGVLLANIDTREIGPAQLRLVPAFRNK